MLETRPVRFQRTYQDTVVGPCAAPTRIITSTNTSYGSNLRVGTENLGHHEQERLGVTATTPFTGEFSNINVSSGDIYRRATGIACPQSLKPVIENRRSGHIFTASARAKPTTTMDQAADNIATAIFIGKANSAITSISGMTLLGELRETVQMIRSPLKSFRHAVDRHFLNLRRRSWRAISNKNKVRILNDMYLEAIFGWTPLLGDISDALTAYERFQTDTREIIYISGYGTQDSVDALSSSSSSMNGITVITNIRDKSQTSVRYIGGVRSQVLGRNVAHARDLCGFRLDQFVPTLWELIPNSFVVDYFTNVGDIISAACFSASNLTWRCKNIKRVTSREVNGRVDTASMAKALGVNYRGAGGNPGSSSHNWTQVVRSADGVGIPSLTFMLPGSGLKWLNLGALSANYGLTRNHVNRR